MTVHYFDSWGHERTVEVKAEKQIQPNDRNGHPCIKNMKRANDAKPEILGVFENEEIRDQEISNIITALKSGVEEYTVKNSFTEGRKSTDFVMFTGKA